MNGWAIPQDKRKVHQIWSDKNNLKTSQQMITGYMPYRIHAIRFKTCERNMEQAELLRLLPSSYRWKLEVGLLQLYNRVLLVLKSHIHVHN